MSGPPPTFSLCHIRRALKLANLSPDPSTRVGAVIVSSGGNRAIGWGFNDLPYGVSPDPAILHDRETKLSLMVHAEANAIFCAARSGRPTDGATMYVVATDDTGITWGAPPCFRYGCCHAAIQAGIRRVVTLQPKLSWSKWHNDNVLARDFLARAGVELVEIPQDLGRPE